MKTNTVSVKTVIVSSDDGTHTYEVKKTLLDDKGEPAEGKDAILIGLHPTTRAEEPYKTDLSTNHLICKMRELGLRSVRILNLFSRVHESEKLSARGLEVDQENLAYIESVLKETDLQTTLFILAWGNSMATCGAVNMTKARVSNLLAAHHPQGKLYQLSAPSLALESEECVHVLYLGIRHKREPWSLREYRFPKRKFTPEKPAKKGGKKKSSHAETSEAEPRERSTEESVEPSKAEVSMKEGEAK